MRLRVGVLVWLVSWVPFALIFGLRHPWLEAVWSIQIVLGLVGLALAGGDFATAVKTSGWRKGPSVAWHELRGSQLPGAARVESAPPHVDDTEPPDSGRLLSG